MPAHGTLQWFHFGPGGVSSGPPVPPASGGNPEARARLVELVAELKASIEGGVGTHFDPEWTELQYGYYPNGGWYHRHVDSGSMGMTHPALGPGKLLKRACSFVLYLNQGWTAADAGHLRVYDSRALDATYQDVPPTAATLVVFKSDEVMRALAHRAAPAPTPTRGVARPPRTHTDCAPTTPPRAHEPPSRRALHRFLCGAQTKAGWPLPPICPSGTR